MRVNDELKMTELLMDSDVYALVSCLSSWLKSLPTKRLKLAMICSSYLDKLILISRELCALLLHSNL